MPTLDKAEKMAYDEAIHKVNGYDGERWTQRGTERAADAESRFTACVLTDRSRAGVRKELFEYVRPFAPVKARLSGGVSFDSASRVEPCTTSTPDLLSGVLFFILSCV